MIFDEKGYFEALEYARAIHKKQKRGNGDPYIFHCIKVSMTILSLRLNHDLDNLRSKLVIAAVLHDCIEDAKISIEQVENEIRDKFGSFAFSVVKELTQDKTLPWAERRRKMVEHCGAMSLPAQIVKLADRLDNVTDLHSMGAEFQARVLGETEEMLQKMKGACPELEERLRAAAAKYSQPVAIRSDKKLSEITALDIPPGLDTEGRQA